MYKCLFLLLLMVPFHARAQQTNEFREFPDLPYLNASTNEADSLQRLNLVIPGNPKNPPLLIWIGGGAWAYVNRNMEMDLARKFASEGIAVASVGHRLSTAVWIDPNRTQGARHPDHVQDLAAAFKWLYEHANEYGYDQENIFVGGYSSGGHLAALLGLDTRYLEDVGLSVGKIKGLIPIAGAYDISHYHQVFAEGRRPELAVQHVEAVFGNTEKNWLEASPTEYLENLSVPILLISENNSFNYTRILEDRIRETDFRNFQVIHLHRIGHGALWQHMSQEENSIYRNYIVQFIREQQEG